MMLKKGLREAIFSDHIFDHRRFWNNRREDKTK